jgi:hypothetical protein
MADEHCSGCGAEVGVGICMCPDGTPTVRDKARNAAIEECAELVENMSSIGMNSLETASNIRALKS